MWDIASRQEIRDGRGHTRPVRKIIFTPDKKHLATAGIDGTVRFWDPNSLKEVRQILAHPNGVGTITFSPDGKYLVTASRANAQPIPGVCTVQRRWFSVGANPTRQLGHSSR